MKKIIFLYLIIFTTIFSATYKYEIGFASPMQFQSPRDDINGFRISTAYTVNKNVTGLDFVLLASGTEGEFNGIRFGGLLNHVEKGGKIISIFNFLNSTKGSSEFVGIGNVININETTKGMRLGLLLNYAQESSGLDLALVNISSYHKGIQIGFINIATNLVGKQFGVLNYAKNSDISPLFPFFNKGN